MSASHPSLLSPPSGLAMPASVVALLRPPYQKPEQYFSPGCVASVPIVPGTIFGVVVTEAAGPLDELDRTIESLRKHAPSCPVIIILSPAVEDSLSLTAHAIRRRARGVIDTKSPLRDQLERFLTFEEAIPDDVVEWLDTCGVRLSPTVAALILHILRLAPQYPTLTELLTSIRVPETSARFRMQKKRLPAPSRWYQGGRALYAALRIQSKGNTCLLRLAHEMGYADHSALSQLVYRAFGVRPAGIRGTLGWEWLMERWVARHRVPIRRDWDAFTRPLQTSSEWGIRSTVLPARPR